MTVGPRLRLSALHAATFLGMGVYLPFFPVWLGDRSLDPAVIGLILAVPILTRILVTAPLMSLTDGPFGARGLLVASHAALVLVYGALAFAGGAWAITGLVALMAVAQATLIPANDLVTINAVQRDAGLAYGRLRVWGSVAFLAANLGAGYAVGALGPTAVIWVLAGLPLLGLAATFAAVPHSLPGPSRTGDRGAAAKRNPRALWWVMAAAACIQATHGSLYAFGSLHWRGLGFTDPVIGALWAIGVVAEILLFALLGHLEGRRAAVGLLVLGAAAAVVRFGVLSTDPGPAVTFACQALHGLSFGATHLGTIAAVAALVPEEARGRAQGALGTLLALAAAASTLASGVIYRAAGPLVFLAMVPLGVLGFALALAAGRAMRAAALQPQSDGAGGESTLPS